MWLMIWGGCGPGRTSGSAVPARWSAPRRGHRPGPGAGAGASPRPSGGRSGHCGAPGDTDRGRVGAGRPAVDHGIARAASGPPTTAYPGAIGSAGPTTRSLTTTGPEMTVSPAAMRRPARIARRRRDVDPVDRLGVGALALDAMATAQEAVMVVPGARGRRQRGGGGGRRRGRGRAGHEASRSAWPPQAGAIPAGTADGMAAPTGIGSDDCCRLIMGAPPGDGATAAGPGAYGCPTWARAVDAAGHRHRQAAETQDPPRSDTHAGTPFPGSRPARGPSYPPRGPGSLEPKW